MDCPAGDLHSSPRCFTRYLLALGFVGAIFAVIPQTPLNGPVGGMLVLLSVIVCCWFSGVGPALLMPFTIWIVSRLPFNTPARPLIPSAREFLVFFALTMLMGAMGLAGQSRRRLRTATREHDARIHEQARALSAARIIFREIDGRITSWTDGARELYGWTASEATGRIMQELLRTEFPVPLDVIHETLLRDGQWRGELIQTGKGDQRLNVVTHYILYSDECEDSRSVAEVHTDVTNLRLAEAAIRDSDRRKDIFVATLAHELRNPLAPLRSGLDVLRMTRKGSADDAAILEIMHRQLDHMVRMVDDLLDVTRMNTGKVELRLSPVNLADLVRDAVAACRTQIDTAGHELTVTIPQEDIQLEVDAARLVQVLTNLLSNAVKFTDAGGRICLSALPENGQIAIHVADTGCGIPATALPHVFEMFAQVDDPHFRSSGGLGLGLNIVRTLVELHGGTVEARSEGPGRGSDFIVRLPMIMQNATARATSLPNDSAPDGKSLLKRVLVVDDNRDAANLLTLMLTKSGFQCQSVFDGPSALLAVDDFRPEAVILDLGMPGMSGLEVAERLRAKERDERLLLIAVTGWDKEHDRLRSRQAGFDHHVAKPVPHEQLRTLLGSSR
ncbi:MAG: response regulator [Planctomycetaceae bacterium]|nr:response regulator [Planctomycetaceae bacterium]